MVSQLSCIFIRMRKILESRKGVLAMILKTIWTCARVLPGKSMDHKKRCGDLVADQLCQIAHYHIAFQVLSDCRGCEARSLRNLEL